MTIDIQIRIKERRIFLLKNLSTLVKERLDILIKEGVVNIKGLLVKDERLKYG